jgi:hypothetical protein
MAQSADADYTNAITGLRASGVKRFVCRCSCAHQRPGVDAFDGLRNRIGKPRIDDAIVTESALVSVGEGESSSFGAVLAIA